MSNLDQLSKKNQNTIRQSKRLKDKDLVGSFSNLNSSISLSNTDLLINDDNVIAKFYLYLNLKIILIFFFDFSNRIQQLIQIHQQQQQQLQQQQQQQINQQHQHLHLH